MWAPQRRLNKSVVIAPGARKRDRGHAELISSVRPRFKDSAAGPLGARGCYRKFMIKGTAMLGYAINQDS